MKLKRAMQQEIEKCKFFLHIYVYSVDSTDIQKKVFPKIACGKLFHIFMLHNCFKSP